MASHDGLDSRAMLHKLNKAIAALLVNFHFSKRTIDCKVGPNVCFVGLWRNVSNINIGVGGISSVHSFKLERVSSLIALVLSPAHTNATRSNLPALHTINGCLSILLAAEGDKAITLGSASGVIPHDTSIPEAIVSR